MLSDLMQREVTRKQFLLIIFGMLASLTFLSKLVNTEKLLQQGGLGSVSTPTSLSYGHKNQPKK